MKGNFGLSYKTKREQMVLNIKAKYGFSSYDVLSAMLQIPREVFLHKQYRNIAYDDNPVSIGDGQTMSQPYTVAFMTDLLDLTGKEKVLEIGTGSGYQAAVLSKLAKEVFSIEIIPELAERAKESIKKLGLKNVYIKVGSGEWGWIEKSPFDSIIVTAGLEEEVPKELIKQLKDGGTIVVPMGKGADKTMYRVKKYKNKLLKEDFGIFRFVPFVKENA